MGKTLYLECNAGISGDMTVAALLDLGADEQALMQALSTIPAEGYSVKISRVNKGGIDCCDFDVVLDAAHENHDHDMEYLHGHDKAVSCEDGHDHEHHHEHHHDDDHHHEHHHDDDHHHGHHHDDDHHHEHHHDDDHHHEHHHDDDHHHGHHHHHHEHRGLAEIIDIIDRTKISDRAKNTAKKIFRIVAQAEAKAHGLPEDQVHFHEVGAIDSIVDIIAVSVCLDLLDIDKAIIPKLCEGYGTVRCQHGILPIPVPATANIISAYNIPMELTNVKGELVTPTGAAIAAAIRTDEALPENVLIQRIGLGAGKRSYERLSILRAMLIYDADKKVSDGLQNSDPAGKFIWKLESNIDDCSGEALGFVVDQLLEAGARDAFTMPVYMKKNRPGSQLNVICDEEKIEELERIIFTHTTTIGIRKIKMERSVLRRQIKEVETPYGPAKVKICDVGEIKKIYPEHESVIQIVKDSGRPYQEIANLIVTLAGGV